MRKYISWTFAALFLGVFVYQTGSYIFYDGPEIDALTVLSLVAGATLLVMASDKSYNSSMDNMKRLDGVGHIPIEKFFEAFANLDTPLGKPWLGKIKLSRRPCIIWGPNRAHEYIYAYKTLFTGSLYVAYNELPSFIQPTKEQRWHMSGSGAPAPGDDYRDLICYKLDIATMVDDLRDRCLLYKQHRPIPPMPEYKQGTLYRFDEKFRWTGQDFTLSDIDGNPIYRVTGALPLKTFHIYDARDESEVFRMTKRVLHVFPHYDFYRGDEKLGTLRKKFDLMHDRYVMPTAEGKIMLQNVTATIGENFQVRRNGEIIGTIAEKLNLTLDNLVFDNYVIHARDTRDDLLLTALAVMVARGQARKRFWERRSEEE